MKENTDTKFERVVYRLFLIGFRFGILCFVLAFTSCRSVRTVTVPERHIIVAHQTDTLTLRDSCYVHDSVMVAVVGDTVRIERYNIQYRDRWRDRIRTDTLLRTDTITVVQQVSKPPNAWQRFRQTGEALFAALFVVGLLLVVAHLRRR